MSPDSPPSVALLLRLSWPAIVVFVAFAVRNALDVWMVGSLGDVELAGIAGGVYVFYLPQTLGLGILAAVNTLVAQSFGRKLHLECRRLCFQGFYLGIVIGGSLMLLIPFCPWLFSLSGHEAEVQLAETTYLQMAMFALIPQFIAAAANNYFFAIAKPKIAMIVSLVALLLNGTLNYAFIFGNFGAPRMEIAGAALATVIAASVQALILVSLIVMSTRKHARRPPRLWFYAPSRSRIRRIFRVGLPNGIHECAEVAIWSVALVFLVGQFGTAHLAAAALLLTLIDMFYAPYEGFGGALTALVGREIGNLKHNSAHQWTKVGLKLTLPFMAITSIACLLWRTPLIALLTDNPEVQAIAESNFLLFPAIMLAFALIAVYDCALVGAGDTLWPMLAHLSTNLLLLIGGGCVLVFWFPAAGSTGVWTLAAIALVFVAGLFVLRWCSGIWKSIDLFDDESSLFDI